MWESSISNTAGINADPVFLLQQKAIIGGISWIKRTQEIWLLSRSGWIS